MKKIFVVDTETGGLDCNRHSLLSVCALVGDLESGAVLEHYYRRILCEEYCVTGRALEVNQIDLRNSSESVPPAVAAEGIKKLIASHFGGGTPSPLGHNVPFDVGFLRAHLFPKYYPLSYRAIDTCAIMQGLLQAGVIAPKSASLVHCCEYAGIPLEAHDAFNDAVATFHLFRWILGRMKFEVPV